MDPITCLLSAIVAAGTTLGILRYQMGDVHRRLGLLEPEIAPLKVALARVEAKVDILLSRWNHHEQN